MKTARPLLLLFTALVLAFSQAPAHAQDTSNWTCEDFRANGVDPNNPYQERLDRDKDGFACDPSGDWGDPAPPIDPAPVDPTAEPVVTPTTIPTTTPDSTAAPTSTTAPAQPSTQPTAPAQQTTQPTAPASKPSQPRGSDMCAKYDAWSWAQSEFDLASNLMKEMDPDGNGIVCDHLTINGFGPVIWRSDVPSTAEQVRFLSVVDKTTIVVMHRTAPITVRLHETKPALPTHCGYDEARDYLEWMLGLAPDDTLYIEPASGTLADKDEVNGYVWFDIDDRAYMANDVMLRQGWSDLDTAADDRLYADVLEAARDFGTDHLLGVHLACGGFEEPIGSEPTLDLVRQAMRVQPNQGQFAKWTGTQPSNQPSNQAPATTSQPDRPSDPVAQPTATAAATSTEVPSVEPTPTTDPHACEGVECGQGSWEPNEPVEEPPADTIPIEEPPASPAA